MILNFLDSDTEDVFISGKSRKFPQDILTAAQRKLGYLNDAVHITDLLVPNSNKLHDLHADREGQKAIWVNRQWRICFTWVERSESNAAGKPGPGDAINVELTDYH